MLSGRNAESKPEISRKLLSERRCGCNEEAAVGSAANRGRGRTSGFAHCCCCENECSKMMMMMMLAHQAATLRPLNKQQQQQQQQQQQRQQ